MTARQIGALLRKAREKRGWTWNRTATESGLKADQIKGIEQGTTAYTINSLLALCKVVGLHLHLQAKGSEAHSTKGATGSKEMKIKAKVELSKVEQWNTDWKNESEKANELKKLEWDMKMAIYERCGVDLPNISIELEVSD